MYGGNSGCSGIVIYNTKAKGDNAVYGYYIGDEIHLETGDAEKMKAVRDGRESACSSKEGLTLKLMGVALLIFTAFTVFMFIVAPLRFGFAALLFSVIAYVPALVIVAARTGIYNDEEELKNFRRYHGCEHAIVESLTKKREATIAALRSARYYDSECGTAYAGYVLCIAAELAVLVMFWPGLLKAAGLLFLTILVLLAMIIWPSINPFVLLQRPVVMQPTERELALGVEIMNKMKEL